MKRHLHIPIFDATASAVAAWPPLGAVWRRALLAVLTLGLLAGTSVQALAPLPMAVTAAATDAKSVTKAQDQDRSVQRHQPVTVNLQYLDPQAGTPAPQVGVELFDGAVLTLDLQRIEQRGSGNYTWHGKVQGYNKSRVTLSVVGGQVAGTIVLVDDASREGGVYQIQSGPDGVPSLRQIDPNGFPPDHPPGSENLRPPHATGKALSGAADTPDGTKAAAADSGATIDVMVLYSNKTAAAAGAGIGAQIQQAVDTANAVYANSGVTTRLRLVHIEPANYSESGDYVTDLNWLSQAAGVAALRNTYGADMVSMFVESWQYCGMAWVGPGASYAFSVINRGCASVNYSFPHELGHNFGALHDPYVDPGTSPYAYGHGIADPKEGWRDVMAYNDACAAAGTSCTRIAYFSNPNLTYGNPPDPLGSTAISDVARVHNQNAVTVANFRASVTGGCSYTLSPISASVGAGAGSGSFTVTAGAGCAWNTVSNAPWLSVGAGSGTTASGTLNFAWAANTGDARSGTFTVGGQTFTVNQASGCSYSLTPASASIAAGGGSGTATLAATSGCGWSASSSASWLSISSAASGTGSATVSYTVAANTGAARGANLTVGGITFVVTQAATTTPSSDLVWVEDAVPAGATLAADAETWNWVSSNPAPFSGALAHQSGLVSGLHQHYFYNATSTLSVGVGETLFAYVYLDAANPPSEVMLQWTDGTNWEHRAYWGANLIAIGVAGTASHYAMGSLPAAGQWVRLEVPAAAVGLEGRTVNGMAFTLYNGRATWDRAGKATASPTSFSVSGTVATSGGPLAGVTFTATGGVSCSVSNASGQYSCTVPQGYSGTVTPTLSGYSFTPVARTYSNVVANQSAQNYTAASDIVWVEDAVPAGATTLASDAESWNWVSSNPAPFSGALAHQSGLVSGLHQHYFYNATSTLSVGVGETLFAYVYLDAANPPSEVMLQWNDGTNWEHRAYWGANLITWGVAGTASRYAMGALPAAGQWVRLEVPAAAVGLEGRTVNGMAFTLYNGRATWDRAGKAIASPTSFSVSGTVATSGGPLAGVTFTATGGVSCSVSNASGQYSCTVPQGYSGTVTPTLSGYSFTPVARTYSNVVANQSAQNYTAASDIVWVEDAVPAGATTLASDAESWNWVSSNPAPFSGALAHQSGLVSGLHQHYFYNATSTLSVGVGETLFAYVYLDAANPPSEVMLQWNDGTNWEHRAYWGANLITWGVAGTASRYAMGALPAAGQWVRLEVPAAAVGLEGRTVNGMAFTLYNGRATWDRAGKR